MGVLRGAECRDGGGQPRSIEILDLPGTYSLAALSPDEMVVNNVAAGRVPGQAPPDCILAILDASNLRRNLYLVSQLLEMGLPMVVALNMMDVARSRGLRIDTEALGRRLGVIVVPIVATDADTIAPLRQAIESALADTPSEVHVSLPETLAAEAGKLTQAANRAEAVRILLDRDGYAETEYLRRGGTSGQLNAARERLAAAGVRGANDEVRARYGWIDTVLEGVIERPAQRAVTWTDRIDAVLTHKVGGALILLIVLALVFQSIFRWAEPLMNLIDAGFAGLSALVAGLLPQEAVQSLICDGLIGGVGGVIIFLPQIMILFALIAVLEDCGYMARAAFMVDRIMRSAGLSGRSFIPLLSSFACAVPAIMGSRVIADRRDRFVTILIAPYMSCSARLPVYILLIAAFVPRVYYLGWIGLPGLVMLAMYLVGIVVAIPIAWLLKKTVLRGPAPPFVLELPSYKWPRPRAVLQRITSAGMHFLTRAGSVILLVSLVVWALGYFPRSPRTEQAVRDVATAQGWDEARIGAEIDGAMLRQSFLGRMGRAVEPVVKPLGWDWRIGSAAIASFPAREVVVATLGTIFNLSDADEESEGLRDALQSATWPDGRPLFTLPVALSIMVFFALCAQCSSTLVMIGRETRSWLWPVFSFVSMTAIAYVAAFAVYHATAA
jgi:ferrous iron transport protein B